MTTKIFIAPNYYTDSYDSLDKGDWFMYPTGDLYIKVSSAEALDLRSGCFLNMGLPSKVLRIAEVNITIKTSSRI
jgi:hypothetical protein